MNKERKKTVFERIGLFYSDFYNKHQHKVTITYVFSQKNKKAISK